MSLESSVNSHIDRVPPKHDSRWVLGFARVGAVPEPIGRPSRHLDLAARQCIVQEGDKARSIYMVLEGGLMLSKLLPDGRRQIIELLGPGDVFGWTTSGTHDSSADTLSACRIVAYDRAMVDASPALQLVFAERIKSQLCAMHDHIILLGRKSAAERVATFLMRLVDGRGGAGCSGPVRQSIQGDQTRLRIVLTRQEIADYLGLTLETVSRAFSHLKRTGALSYQRHDEVIVSNVCGLCRLTGSH